MFVSTMLDNLLFFFGKNGLNFKKGTVFISVASRRDISWEKTQSRLWSPDRNVKSGFYLFCTLLQGIFSLKNAYNYECFYKKKYLFLLLNMKIGKNKMLQTILQSNGFFQWWCGKIWNLCPDWHGIKPTL